MRRRRSSAQIAYGSSDENKETSNSLDRSINSCLVSLFSLMTLMLSGELQCDAEVGGVDLTPKNKMTTRRPSYLMLDSLREQPTTLTANDHRVGNRLKNSVTTGYGGIEFIGDE